jgi:L-gulonolactone oxidase
MASVEESFIIVSKDHTDQELSSSMISAVIATATGGPIPGEVHPLESGQIAAINLDRNGSDSTLYSSTTTVVAHEPARDFEDPKVSLILQELRSLTTPKKTFENWARTFRCAPEQYFTPTSEEDVIRVRKIFCFICG